MASRQGGRKPKHVVDGFDALKALREREGADAAEPTEPVPATARPATPGELRVRAAAQPKKSDIVCYQCGYKFVHTGVLERILCAKCRTWLDSGDHDVHGEWNDDLRTIGCIRICEDAVIKGGLIRANVIALAGGEVKGGELTAVTSLRVEADGPLETYGIETDIITIGAEADVVFSDDVWYTDVCVAGKARGSLRISGQLTVQKGASICGDVQTPSLVVEDGAGLTGEMNVNPALAGEAGD